jgi:hypothetical protein
VPPDTTAPRITITTPLEGSASHQGFVFVQGTASDTGDVVQVGYSLNGGAEQGIGILAGPSVVFSFVTTGLVEGVNTITVFAYDRAGNRGSAERRVDHAVVVPRYHPRNLVEAYRSAFVTLVASRIDGFVGYVDTASEGRPFFVAGSTQSTRLLPLEDHEEVRVEGINDQGAPVGCSYWRPSFSIYHVPTMWANGRPTALERLGYSHGCANSINKSGVIAGHLFDVTAGPINHRPVIWTGTEARVLPDLGAGSAVANAINDNGQVAGTVHSWPHRAVRWNSGNPTALRPAGDYYSSSGSAIASNGIVGGLSREMNPMIVAATIWVGETPVLLPLPAGLSGNTWLTDVNASSDAVGTITWQDGELISVPIVWHSGRAYVLNDRLTDPEWTITSVLRINDAGQIMATARRGRDETGWPVRLEPTPGGMLRPVLR